MRKKKNQILPIVVLVLLFVGIVYAILQTDLQINGTTKIANNLWDVHFENVVVNQNSVPIGTGDSAATIDSNNTLKVDFSVTLSLPGDFYEFTVDVVNGGTIDAMIGTLNKILKVNNVETETIPNYLNYTITYDDDSEVIEKQLLAKNSSKKIKVRVEFRTDINAEDLPDTTTLSMTVEPTYVQADDTAVGNNSLYGVFQLEAESGSGLVQKYTGEHKDSFTKPAIRDIYYFYGGDDVTLPIDHSPYIEIDGTSSSSSSSSNPGTNPNPNPDPDPDPDPSSNASIISEIIQNKWNVLFGGYCWQMYRTTDTGGVKLLYNGTPSDGQCSNTNRIPYIEKNSKFNYSSFGGSIAIGSHPITVGYMNDSSHVLVYKDSSYSEEPDYATVEGRLFGNGFTYSNGVYTLTDTTTSYNSTHHYTCNNTTGSCTQGYLRFYYKTDYFTYVEDDKDYKDYLDELLTGNNANQKDSEIKGKIDYWYHFHMNNYTSMLEDTIFCNDRSIIDYGGWNPNGENKNGPLLFKNSILSNDLSCTNVTDQFSLSNNKAKLTYPIGLMTPSEAKLLNNLYLIKTDYDYWLSSPHSYSDSFVYAYYVGAGGNILYGHTEIADDYRTVRPVISLKAGTLYSSGDGSQENPYVVG